MKEIEKLQQEVAVHQKLEWQLQDALLFAESIIETVREPLLVLDDRLRVNRANRSFYRVFGTTPDVFEKHLLFELEDGCWNIPELRTLLEEILPQNTTFDDFEVEHEFPRIGKRIIVFNARRLYCEDQRTQMILLAMEDVTEQRKIEATLQLYVKKLEWSNRELQDFAYISSHDLQEPLRAIQAFSERLYTKHGSVLDDQGRDYLERIQSAAGRMRILISDLLAYSRVATKGRAFVPVDLNKVAQTVVSDLSNRIEETGGSVEIRALPEIEADISQMRQLFQNLIGNALKFHQENQPPIVKIYCLLDKINQPVGQPADTVQIIVEDNGIGLEEKYNDRIFVPFERLHNQRKYAGTGIGLAICRKIMERHAGDISVRSTPGQGAKFLITLPVHQARQVLEESGA